MGGYAAHITINHQRGAAWVEKNKQNQTTDKQNKTTNKQKTTNKHKKQQINKKTTDKQNKTANKQNKIKNKQAKEGQVLVKCFESKTTKKLNANESTKLWGIHFIITESQVIQFWFRLFGYGEVE